MGAKQGQVSDKGQHCRSAYGPGATQSPIQQNPAEQSGNGADQGGGRKALSHLTGGKICLVEDDGRHVDHATGAERGQQPN